MEFVRKMQSSEITVQNELIDSLIGQIFKVYAKADKKDWKAMG